MVMSTAGKIVATEIQLKFKWGKGQLKFHQGSTMISKTRKWKGEQAMQILEGKNIVESGNHKCKGPE